MRYHTETTVFLLPCICLFKYVFWGVVVVTVIIIIIKVQNINHKNKMSL